TFAVNLHDTVMHSERLSYLLGRTALSAREVEILQWIAAGKSQQDVGDILSISVRTVEVHVRSSREKLCTLTTAQAVGRAVSLGLITPG
ncbi:MAG: helix-turn-helix transcriptional regulator, partial [Pseudomonadota bacterium]